MLIAGGAVRILIRIPGDEDGWLQSLYQWLDQDHRLSGADLKLQAASVPDAQGGAFDVINAMLNDGISVSSLAISFATWRSARSGAPTVSFERDGHEVKLLATDPSDETVRRIVELAGDLEADEDDSTR